MAEAVKAIGYPAMRGIDLCLHHQPGGIGSAMMLHLHACRARDIIHATELQRQDMFDHSIIRDSIVFEDGMAQLPDRPSWGVERDIGGV